MIDKKSKKATIRQVAVVILIILLLNLVFNSTALYRWVNRQQLGRSRDFFFYIIRPWHSFCSKAGFTRPARQMKSVFNTLTGVQTDEKWFDIVDQGGVAAAPVTAELSPAPTALPTPVPVNRLTVQKPFQVLMIGDSMVGYLASAFRRASREIEGIELESLLQYSSGLSRPDYFNWPARVEELFTMREYGCIVVMLGMNDAQSFREKGIYYRFGSEQWLHRYRQRVVRFLSQLQGASLQVYWLEIPSMRTAAYNAKMQLLNNIYEDVCSITDRAEFVSTRLILDDNTGAYAHFLEIDNRMIRVRAEDGKHLSRVGADLVVEKLLGRITDDFHF